MDEAAQPFRLKRLEISNFRGIRHLALDFTDREGKPLDKVLFVGPNGCGKTSIMRALAMLLNRDLEPTSDDPSPEYFGSSYFEITAETSAGDMSVRSLKNLGLQRLNRSAKTAPVAVFIEGIASPNGKRASRPALREIEAKIVRALTRRALGRATSESSNDPMARIEAVWKEIGGEPQLVDALQESNDPGSDFRVVLRDPGQIPPAITSLPAARALAAQGFDIPRMVTLDQVSAGQEMMLGYGAGLIFADGPFEVILIDESELHLHPQWHMKLPDIVRAAAPTAQIFFTSHSPYMVDQFAAHEVFLLNSSPKGIVCARLDQHAEFGKWKGTLRTGEFWSYAGERWVGDAGDNREN
jgi:energy-coupling factor transporter ATP-binding protein EcfA2